MRYVGQGHEITVKLPLRNLRAAERVELRRSFETEYARLYGRSIPHLEVEVLSWSLVVKTRSHPPTQATRSRNRPAAKAEATRPVYDPVARRFRRAAIHDRGLLAAGMRVRGPALIVEDQTTTVVGTGFDAQVNSLGYLVLERQNKRRSA